MKCQTIRPSLSSFVLSVHLPPILELSKQCTIVPDSYGTNTGKSSSSQFLLYHISFFTIDSLGLINKFLRQCYAGERGLQLQRQAAQRTMSAKANPIVEVPYLLVNDYAPNTDANAVNILSLNHLIQKWLGWRRSHRAN
jgi:hypothetical protein